MANHKSALKQQRQSDTRRDQNRFHRARLRTSLKKCRAALASAQLAEVRVVLPATLSMLDRAARLGAIHDNAAARTKSRLMRAANKLAATA